MFWLQLSTTFASHICHTRQSLPHRKQEHQQSGSLIQATHLDQDSKLRSASSNLDASDISCSAIREVRKILAPVNVGGATVLVDTFSSESASSFEPSTTQE